MRDLWRTIFLMGFASRIYRDQSGNIYLLDGNRWDGVPKTIYKVPDLQALELLMRETCWSGFQTALIFLVGIALACLIRLSGAHSAWFLLLVPLGALYWIGRRRQNAAQACCTRIPTKGQALVLMRAAELAGLNAVTLVRVCAALAFLVGFAVCTGMGGIFDPETAKRLEGLEASATVLIGFVTFRLIVAGGHVLNPDNIDLGFENRA
jgi:hypothetical protein